METNKCEKKDFKELFELDIKGVVYQDFKGLNYISWANAYKLLIEADPKANYRLLADEDGFPVFSKHDCHMVMTEVTMNGVSRGMFLPVMDNNHNAVKLEAYEIIGKGGKKTKVKAMDSRDIGDSIMRCLVKNIALFGIGLRLYCGMEALDYDYLRRKLKQLKAEELSKILEHYEAEDTHALSNENLAEIGLKLKWV